MTWPKVELLLLDLDFWPCSMLQRPGRLLNNLALDIQEAIHFLPRTINGRDAINEAELRPIATNIRQDQAEANVEQSA